MFFLLCKPAQLLLRARGPNGRTDKTTQNKFDWKYLGLQR